MIFNLLLFFIGVITWPIWEYLLHRFSGHKYRFPRAFYVEHQTHHAQKDYFAPTYKKVLAAIIILSAMTALNSLWLGRLQSLIFSSGFISMYLFYEWTHYSFHMYPPKTKLGLKLRKQHFSHHYINPHFNHGVTNSLADHLFGTYRESKVVPVPRRFAMDWLFDGQGLLQDKWKKDFEIKG